MQVLILDSHDSHNFVELIKTTIENQIEKCNCQLTQATGFKPFKEFYNGEARK